jgi:phage terminase small subunit
MTTKNEHGLTVKQERFAQAYVETGSASEAYRQAFNAEKMKPATVWVESSKLLNSPKVASRVEAINKAIEEKNRLNGTRLREIVRSGLLNEAQTADSPSARIAALKLLGELSDVQAFGPQRIETEQKITTDAAQKKLDDALTAALTDPNVVQLFEKKQH